MVRGKTVSAKPYGKGFIQGKKTWPSPHFRGKASCPERSKFVREREGVASRKTQQLGKAVIFFRQDWGGP